MLQQHILTLDDLHHRFLSYQTSFNKLLVEIARRRQYREAADKIVEGMMGQLDAMADGPCFILFALSSLNMAILLEQKSAKSERNSIRSMAAIYQQIFAFV